MHLFLKKVQCTISVRTYVRSRAGRNQVLHPKSCLHVSGLSRVFVNCEAHQRLGITDCLIAANLCRLAELRAVTVHKVEPARSEVHGGVRWMDRRDLIWHPLEEMILMKVKQVVARIVIVIIMDLRQRPRSLAVGRYDRRAVIGVVGPYTGSIRSAHAFRHVCVEDAGTLDRGPGQDALVTQAHDRGPWHRLRRTAPPAVTTQQILPEGFTDGNETPSVKCRQRYSNSLARIRKNTFPNKILTPGRQVESPDHTDPVSDANHAEQVTLSVRGDTVGFVEELRFTPETHCDGLQ